MYLLHGRGVQNKVCSLTVYIQRTNFFFYFSWLCTSKTDVMQLKTGICKGSLISYLKLAKINVFLGYFPPILLLSCHPRTGFPSSLKGLPTWLLRTASQHSLVSVFVHIFQFLSLSLLFHNINNKPIGNYRAFLKRKK